MTLAAHRTTAEPAAMLADGAASDTASQWIASALAALRARAWLVPALALAGLLLAVVYLRTADYTYTVALRVAPAPSSARESTGLGALGNLASLTGVTIEAAPATPFRLFVEGVRSREVAVRLARDPLLMQQVFAREWDAGNRRWVEPNGVGVRLRNGLYSMVGAPVQRWSPPDAARLQAFLGAHVLVDQNPRTPLVTISIDTTDPSFARQFLQKLHATTDMWLREKSLRRTAQNIAYINARLPGVTMADHRQALFATLSDQEQRFMMASNPAAFAAEPFGDIAASPNPTKPRQLPILAVATLLGALLGIILAVLLPRRTLALRP